MEYKLKLIKGLSYHGVVSATKGNPFAVTADKEVADNAVKSGYFSLIDIITDDENKNNQDNLENQDDDDDKTLEQMTVPKLKEVAKQNNIELGNAVKKPDIISVINEHFKRESGDDVINDFIGPQE